MLMSGLVLMLAHRDTGLTRPFVTKTPLMIQDTITPVRIELEKTRIDDMIILYVRDTASTTADIGGVLGKGYGELMQFIAANKLQPLKFIAWYYSAAPPWSVDIAVETDKTVQPLSGRIQSRIQKGGEIVIAHMWGPYDQVGKAYSQIEGWLKANNRQARDAPFEVYLNDPSTVKNPSEIRTDICQPLAGN
jgi:effector-binding domain-containing protein